MSGIKLTVERLLAEAGMVVNGGHPWDPIVHNEAIYKRLLAQGSLGLGESYMDGWWDCEALDEGAARILQAGLDTKLKITIPLLAETATARLFNRQSRNKAFQIGEAHYDIGNDLFERMLDTRMVYSCGYWSKSATLDEAQEAKLDLVCRKLALEPGMKLLDVGCGWGSLLKHAAERYGAEGVGITVSKEQAALAMEHCSGLPIDIRLEDYRGLGETFDRIASLGMIEHVGYKNYRQYMQVMHRCLADDGLFLLQTIGGLRSSTSADPWIDRYIFPNGMLPSIKQLSHSIEDLFVVEDLHNFGADYDKTLMAWYRNFNDRWMEIQPGYGERFYRMWRYYLLTCAGAFRARRNQLWQIVLSKSGVAGGYITAR